ncbi:hypothetical protein [Streptomyces sp. NPDC005752]|uniref:hypothetical protein n=1 Tax=Streptomyces sp. NPDC005752 TaxID=3157065 RepID=UPI0033CFA3DA
MSVHPNPTPDEAARTLRDVEQRRIQAAEGSGGARWVYVVLGLAAFLLLAAPDWVGDDAQAWVSIGYAALAVAYVVLLRTRRGSALLGHRTGRRKEELDGAFLRRRRLTLLAVMATGLVISVLGSRVSLDLPYWRSGAGALLGAAVIFLGPAWDQAVRARAVRGARSVTEDPGAAR